MINNIIYAGVFTILFKNAMSIKVLVRKGLRFKCVQMTPFTFLRTHIVAHWRILFTPFNIGLFYSLGHLWASIKLLDVNEVAIIMTILEESKHPNFK
jgi:hypothetical protein